MLFRKRRERLTESAQSAAVTGFHALDARLPASEAGRGLLRKAFPDHWSFLLGELALYSFVVLVLTGTYLTLFFDPSMTESVYQGSYEPLRGQAMTQAYASTLDISFDVRGGLLIRQIHHWAALVFVAAIGLHMLRIFFTGAFRKPREFNWIMGVTLFLLALLEGFAGYSLPDDLLSGTGLRTAHTIVMSIPVLGTYLSFFIWGGQFPGEEVLPRLYVVHILLVPGVLVALVAVHLMLVVYLKHTHWAARGRTNRNVVGQPMFPQFTAKSTGLFLMVFGLLSGLSAVAQINPVWLYGPYRTDQVATGAQPDWYVGFLEGAMRIMPPWQTTAAGHTVMWNVFLPAVVLPGLLFMVLFAYPFFERWVTGDRREHHLCDRPRNRPTRTALGVAAIVFYAVLLLAGGNDVIAYSFLVSVNALTWIFRIAVFAGPVVAFVVTKRLCLALQDRERRLLLEGEETGAVSQSVYGGISESHRPVDAGLRYRILVRDVPRPLARPQHPATRLQRLRSALSTWYYGDRVEMPAAPDQKRHIQEALAEPARGEARE
ncbi:ubiquinol-cytochrome c reductase cytochrome b subunit [Streptomyces sp. PSKA54]|uniref:Cytochrome bc1 complex cytochrome b subunit n=1 Tax=Streptomyces himalayensis subsp. aureolus TaxID=2758039 RepID=A0A7W2D2A3_9ACTN|nr:ubiquinol-cytochrome c reductase cytochrome b subunit [Streptomyces himalayensis]MBA4863140.1 ubiquinol-cytochrome c reductase cytochrome b subunit [Streptomyces himalayensis subsp. aureolus]